MKLLITILCCIMISCTTTVIQPPDKPNLVGTWACATILEEFTIDFNRNGAIDWPSEVYKNKFKRFDTLIITEDTIKHIQLTRTLDSVILSIREESDPSNITPDIRAPKDSVLYHDTVAISNYETSGDGYNIYLFNSRIIMNNEYHILRPNGDGTGTDTLPYYHYYPQYELHNCFYYVFYQNDPIFINKDGQIEQFVYHQSVEFRHGYNIPIRYTKIN